MKRLAAVTFALVCSLPATVNAQEASASVLATVAQDLRLASEGDTDFGSVGNFAHIETINPSTPSATQTTAQFTASASAHISFSCPTEVTLSGPGGATMTFKPLLAISGFAEGQSSAGTVTCPSFSFANDVQTFWFWLGGGLSVGAGQETGSYSGTFTLTATY